MLLALLALLAPQGSVHPTQSEGSVHGGPSNDLVLHNGADYFVWLSDPSAGAPTGTFPPDTTGGLFWKVVPRELLRHPKGSMQVSALRFQLANLGSVHPPVFWDLWIARGRPSASHPGLVEPDWTDPNGLFLSLGPSGLPGICDYFPECCDSASCVTCICDPVIPPYTGCSPLWSIELQIGSGPGTFLTVPADGSQDLTVTAFEPGGMSTGGPCAAVDYSVMYALSADEQLPDWTGTQISGYGGWQVAGSGLQPDHVTEAAMLQVEFVEPTVSPYLAGDLTWGFLPGLAGLHPPASGGTAALGLHHRASQAEGDGELGANDLALCAASLGPPLSLPGLSVFGAQLLLDPADPAFWPTALVWNGAYTHLDASYYSFAPPDAIFNAVPLPLPPALAGTVVHCQCMWLDLLALTAAASNVAQVHVH